MIINEEILIIKTGKLLEEIEVLMERNPLAHLEKFQGEGRHYVMLSAKRDNYTDEKGIKRPMTPQIHAQRHEALKHKIREAGYGFREVIGTYEGNEEKSLLVPANRPGDEEGNKLVHHAKSWARSFGDNDIDAQDSIFHHDGREGHLIGTNSTGFPGKDKTVSVGKNHYGQRIETEPFKTEFDTRRQGEQRRKFAAIHEHEEDNDNDDL